MLTFASKPAALKHKSCRWQAASTFPSGVPAPPGPHHLVPKYLLRAGLFLAAKMNADSPLSSTPAACPTASSSGPNPSPPPPHAPKSHVSEGRPRAKPTPQRPCGIDVGIPRLSPKFPSQVGSPLLGRGLVVPWKLGLSNNPKRSAKTRSAATPHPAQDEIAGEA